MERIKALINKLHEQSEQNADASVLQFTLQMIQAELVQASTPVQKQMSTSKVSVMLPSSGRISFPGKDILAELLKEPGIKEKEAEIVTPSYKLAEPVEVKIAEYKHAETLQAKQPEYIHTEAVAVKLPEYKLAETPPVKQPGYVHVETVAVKFPEYKQAGPPQVKQPEYTPAEAIAVNPPEFKHSEPLADKQPGYTPAETIAVKRPGPKHAEPLQDYQPEYTPAEAVAVYSPENKQAEPHEIHQPEFQDKLPEYHQDEEPEYPLADPPQGIPQYREQPKTGSEPVRRQPEKEVQAVENKKEDRSGWLFDPPEEIPTLAHQTEFRERNDAFFANGSSLNDRLKVDKKELATVLTEGPVRDLKKAIGINDRFVFLNELFRGDETMYERSLKTINNFRIYPEAEYWIERELKVKLGWDENREAVKHFRQLVKRRFL